MEMLNGRTFILPKKSYLFYLSIILMFTFISYKSLLANPTQIKIAWDPNHEADLAGYNIYYGINPYPYNYATPMLLEYVGNEPKFTIIGLTPGKRYYIVVSAFDQSYNESGPSNEVSGFPTDHFKDLITDYYLDILDRPPEPGGAEQWAAEIERIVSLGIDIKEGFIAAAKCFFNSEEYFKKNNTDEQFVTDLYQTFLNRAPDPDGLNSWLNYLAQGLTRSMLITQFCNSDEFKLYLEDAFGIGTTRPENNLLNDFYRGFLNRFPDTGGFNSWLGLMQDAQCSGSPQQIRDLSHQIALGFIQSAEYGLRNRDNIEYMEDLYNGILRRGADPGGFTGWVNSLNSKTYTREQVFQFFVNSPEFQSRVQEVIDAGCF